MIYALRELTGPSHHPSVIIERFAESQARLVLTADCHAMGRPVRKEQHRRFTLTLLQDNPPGYLPINRFNVRTVDLEHIGIGLRTDYDGMREHPVRKKVSHAGFHLQEAVIQIFDAIPPSIDMQCMNARKVVGMQLTPGSPHQGRYDA